MFCDYPLDKDYTLGVNLTNIEIFPQLLITLNDPN